jgi:ABC-2 type transport system permease protein
MMLALTFAGLGMALGSFVSDPDVATSLGNAIAFPMMFLTSVFWEVALMPEYLQTAATVLPLYHFHRGLRRLMIMGTTEGTLVPFAFLGATAVLSVGSAVAVTSWQDLDG